VFKSLKDFALAAYCCESLLLLDAVITDGGGVGGGGAPNASLNSISLLPISLALAFVPGGINLISGASSLTISGDAIGRETLNCNGCACFGNSGVLTLSVNILSTSCTCVCIVCCLWIFCCAVNKFTNCCVALGCLGGFGAFGFIFDF